MSDPTDEVAPRRDLLGFLDNKVLRDRIYWGILAVGLLAGSLGAVTDGPFRRVMNVLLLGSFIANVIVLNHYPVERRVRMDDLEHIRSPIEQLARFLNLVLVIIYNAALLVLLVALVVRSGAADWSFPVGLQYWAPLMFAGFHFVMAVAAKLHADSHGVKDLTWMGRVAWWTLAFGGSLTMGLSVAMVARPTVNLGPIALDEVELLTFILLMLVVATTQLFFLVGLTTPFDLIMRMRDRSDDRPAQGMPPLVYGLLAAGGGTAVLGLLASRLGLFNQVGDALSSERGAYLLILLPVGLAVFGLYTVARIYLERKRTLFVKKLPTKLRNDIMVYGWASIAGLGLGLLTFQVLTERVDRVLWMEADLNLAKDLIMLTLLATVGPIGIYLNRQAKRVDHIETRLGDFLNDLAESRRAGLTLTAALHTAASTDYGALSKEIEKMSNQVAWGVSFADALRLFQKRVSSSLVERATNLIIEATRTGGSVADLLKAAANDAREIKAMERERRTNLSTYLIIIYVTFLVFMVVIAVLDAQFIPQVAAAQDIVREAETEGTDVGGFQVGAALDREALAFTYYNAAIVQAAGNGIVAGLLSEQRLTAGFRHVAMMVLMAWLVFRWILGAL